MVKRRVEKTVTKTVIKHHTSSAKRPRKKHVKRNSRTHKTPRSSISKETLEEQTLHSLIELQKVHVNMAEKFDKLAVQVENLLALFELAARNFAKQPHMQNTEKDKEFLDKIDKLLDQNKLLAKGLSLMEEKMRERLYGVSPQNQGQVQRPQFRNQSQVRQISDAKLEEI